MSSPSYWLLKSEPTTYSIQDLAQKGTDWWDGVRNHQAKNFLGAMKVGDLAAFYHSSCPETGIVGTVRVLQSAEPDLSALDLASPLVDSKALAKGHNPWLRIQVGFVTAYPKVLLRSLLLAQPEFADSLLVKHTRLSVMPLSEDAWRAIERIAIQ